MVVGSALFATMAFAGQKITIYAPTANLDEFRQVCTDAKEMGANHVWATEIEPSLWIWDRDRYDPYPNWSFKHATVFKYVVPEEMKEFLPSDFAARNLATLKARGKVLREMGLKASFLGMEPAYFPEEAYRAHPAWRGPRCDQARRARTEYYAPCFDNPEVRAMYFKATKILCEACPFDAFSFLTNDSGGGLCWAAGLYPGENGPYACREVKMGERISTYLGVFQNAARAAGLGDVTANVNHVGDTDVIQSLPYLKKGQSVNGKGPDGEAKAMTIGCFEAYGDPTFPVYLLPRICGYAKGLQTVAEVKDADITIRFRSVEDRDAIDFVKAYFGKIGAGPLARAKAIVDFAATRVGEADANALAEIWEAIEQLVERYDSYQTGGHMFNLGTVHQRWLTRPFVAFPEELKPEEKGYYRAFQFQAQEESDADDLSDLQGNKWLKGYGAANLVAKSWGRARPILDKAIAAAAKLAKRHAGKAYGKDLKLLELRLIAFKCVIRNATHAVQFQDYMDRADRTHKPVDRSPNIRHQGAPELDVLNMIVREEIDMSYELADLIDSAPGRIFFTAPKKEWTTVMRFEPDLSASLRKRAVIMENHRRDFLRLYKSKNL